MTPNLGQGGCTALEVRAAGSAAGFLYKMLKKMPLSICMHVRPSMYSGQCMHLRAMQLRAVHLSIGLVRSRPNLGQSGCTALEVRAAGSQAELHFVSCKPYLAMPVTTHKL